MKRVLLTGAAGDIGSAPAQAPEAGLPGAAAERPQASRPICAPTSRSSPPILPASRRWRRPSTASKASSTRAASPSKGPWETILQANIIGCYNLFEAARRKGVKRVVFASSNHAIGFYPRTHHIGTDVTVRPDSRYGVSKAFGEALGALYADKHGLRVLCLRIGNSATRPVDKRRLSIWISPEDHGPARAHRPRAPGAALRDLLRRLLQRAHLVGQHRAYDYGYRPTGRAEDHVAEALAAQAKLAPDPVGRLLPGRPLLQRRVRRRHQPDLEEMSREHMSTRPRILLTHTPDMRRNYYGERALAGLRALGDVVLHEGSDAARHAAI